MEVHFEQQIYTLIGAIPYGQVAAYGQLARLAGAANQSRAVGRILKQLPKESTLPWYRVINSQGKISFPIGSAKYDQQKVLLEQEGVVFIKGKVNLKKYQWLEGS